MTESTVSMLHAVQCGANFILHAAGWLEGGLTMGYEKFILDADFCSALHTYCKGVDMSDEQFALDAFREVGPGKHFFGSQHTLRHYETAFWDSATANNDSFEQWRDAGETRAEDRANAKMKHMLADYEPPPMDDAIDAALIDFIARRKADRADMWY
jgi:trimethylamine--corrinoid protein Co-methyltransferase